MTGPHKSHAFETQVPEGDDRERLVCRNCGWINYVNPKVIVGAVCWWQDQDAVERILLCRRAIEPRLGYWTIPAGFMELKETAEQGAAREAWEEATADIEIETLLGLYSIADISQVHLIYRARLKSPAIAPGPESQEVKLVTWDEIPWEELAFESNRWCLQAHQRVRGQSNFPPFGVPSE